MNSMKNIKPLCIAFFLISTSTFGQTATQKKAEQEFNSFSFVKAIDSYQKLIETNFNNYNAMRNLGDAYIMLRQPEKALPIYAQVVKQKNVPAEYYLYYAQTLRANGQYEASKVWMEKYKDAGNHDNSYVKDFFKNEDLASGIFNARMKYDLEKVNFNTKFNDFGAVKLNDNVVFTSSRDEGVSIKRIYSWDGQPLLDIYQTPMEDASNNTTKKLEGDVNTIEHDGPATFSADGTKMYFSRNNYTNNKKITSNKGVMLVGIYSAELVNGAWTNVKPSNLNNSNYMVYHPSLSQDGKKLYFTSDMPGGFGGTDIYVTDVNKDGSLSTPENLGNVVNTEKNESFPFIYSKEQTLYFSSDGHVGKGLLDIFLALQDKNNHIINVVNLGVPINSEKDDFAYFLSPNGQDGYIASNRKGGVGGDDIYSFTILSKSFLVSGKAIDSETRKVLTSTKVILSDEKGDSINEILTIEDGSYEFEIEPPNNYKLKAEKEGYLKKRVNLIAEIPKSAEMKNRQVMDIYLDKIEIETDIGKRVDIKSISGKAIDSETGKVLASTKVILYNEKGDFINEILTIEDGSYEFEIEPANNYKLKVEKEGYLRKTVNLTAEIPKSAEMKNYQVIDIYLDKIKIGTDIVKLIGIKPIYFDLSKWNIRKDATAELDKIVKVLNENPKIEIELSSHTDCRSSAASNMLLSNRRAQATAEYIKKKISNLNRISGKGYGESKLINYCECEADKKVPCTEEEHQMNRRTEFKVLKY